MRKKFKLNIEIPTSSQSDLAFLLIIFFIITAIFFERTAINFKLPAKSGKTIQLTADKVIEIKLFNDKILFNKIRLTYNEFYPTLEKYILKTGKNKAIIYFSDSLKYKNFIKALQDIKKIGSLKISIKPIKKNEKK